MDKSTVTLLLGLSFGLAVVGIVFIGILVATGKNNGNTVVLPPTSQQYNNTEEWSIVKDANGRTKGVTVHREATVQ